MVAGRRDRPPQCDRRARADMLCSARCQCFLCRELQSCRAADSRKPPGKHGMADNFILRKAEAWEPMKFIRGAARMSVRHWQSREPLAPPKPRASPHKSTSCEQLYTPAVEDAGPFAMRRAPSTDRVKYVEHKPLFKMLGNSRSKKPSSGEAVEPNLRRSVLNFKKHESLQSKNVHEKYVPLQAAPAERGGDVRPRGPDDCCRPPVYTSVDKRARDTPDKKNGTRPPCYDELAERLERNKRTAAPGELANKITQNNNKVVIYFGDSIIRKHNEQKKEEDKKEKQADRPPKEEAIYVNQPLNESDAGTNREVDKGGTHLVSEVQVPEAIYAEIAPEEAKEPDAPPVNDGTYKKDVHETMGADGFVVVEFEGNYERARQLVELVHSGGKLDQNEATVLDEDEHCDWSFIQDWRKRPSSGCRPEEWCGAVGGGGARALRVRVASAAPAHARRLSPPPPAHRATTPPPPPPPPADADSKPAVEEPVTPEGPALLAVGAVPHTTVASAPVRGAPAQTSYALRKHDRPPDMPPQNGVRECNSSSDENRSSGHASMSDSGGGGGEGKAGREEPRRTRQPPRTKHRPHNKLQSPWPGGGGLEDIRSAIKQLTLRSRDSSSTATSGASSVGGGSHGAPEGGSGAEARRRRAPLVRQPSLDTVCTNVTSADEFVWVDSHNRLVELRCVPWTAGEVGRALQAGRCRDVAARMAPDAPPRLAYLLQRALVRIAREAQRLSHNFGFCSKHEVAGAFRVVLSTPLAESCIKGCQRAATMYATSGSAARRLGSAARARTSLAPGRFHRWMLDVRVASFVHEYAAIYLCAGMETLLEEVALISGAGAGPVTPAVIDAAVAACADLWGLLQPYSHLNAGRIASGALSLSRWESISSLGSGSSAGIGQHRQLGMSHDSGITTNGSGGSSASAGTNNSGGSGVSGGSGASGGSGVSSGSGVSAASVLLTTCAGSAAELRAVLRQVHPRHPPLSPAAERALYYFMRCSQLEHTGGGGEAGRCAGGEGAALWRERGAGALPPLGEWVRVARAHASLRPPPAVPDADDVLQAARLLLPHADCPPRPLAIEEAIEPWSNTRSDDVGRAALGLAHRALLSGRADVLGPVRPLLPPAGIDAVDAAGLTALMKAALAGDEQVVAMLLEAGADPNIETSGAAAQHSALLSPRSPTHANAPPAAPPGYTPPTAGWTALVYACAGGYGGSGSVEVARRLLAAGARVDGAPARGDDVCTLTPLQVACGVGNLELVQMLLSRGADPFLSTQLNDALCYSAAAQYGCYSAVAVCCSHGRRACLRACVSARGARGGGALSLEEVLAEGAPPAAGRPPPFTKQQQRALQDAIYYAAETDHLDITLELRSLGVPWSLHAWTLSLAAAADASLDHVIDQLLQDFLQVCPSDDSHYSKQFIYECLPLLFNILRYSKKEGTVLLLADILCACYGWEAVPAVREPPPAAPAPARVDPSYVNNPSLADVTFRVEGRLFYGHKIVLVSESPRLRAMLAPPRAADAPPAAAPPLVQINDIRYHIFEQVMKYLYSGGCGGLDIPEGDVLEVLAAAAFFQLLPLQRHCEARAAATVDLHNLVSVYIHAKVYGATQLLEYCQGFLLQNMVALLTYDDSVKRLLFGKRLPGHNVLAALLVTLQKRIEARKNHAKSR